MLTITIAILPWLLLQCDGARILAFFPIPLQSHQNTIRPIFRALTNRGHEVTLVTSLPDAKAPYKQIIVQLSDADKHFENVDLYGMRKMTWFSDMFIVSDYMEEMIPTISKNPEVQKLIQSTDEKFDLIINEASMNQEAFASLGHKFDTPLVEIECLCPHFWLYHLIGQPYFLSYSVTYYTYSSDEMNFMERLENTIMGVTSVLIRRYYLLPKQEMLAAKYFRYPGWESRPPLMDIMANISLLLQNTHISTHYPHPYNPNVVEIAGVQNQEPMKLPKDLQTYLDKATEGVIYFSFGSALLGHLMPENVRQAFISAFNELPFKVLWKWEKETLPNKPNNVIISKWFPQSGVLSHPNVKAFLTHGGLAGMTEATHHAVPFVVIPFFIDQWKNAKKIASTGRGIILDFDNITAESVTWALNTVITDVSYREAAKRQSMILRDNPMPPVDKAVYWIEYVLRHKGAPHLRTAAASLPWYKYYLIDVVAVLMSCVLLLLFIIYLALRTVYRLLCGRSGKRENTKTKKKYN